MNPRFALAALALGACSHASQAAPSPPPSTAVSSVKMSPPAPPAVDLGALETELVKTHGDAQRARIARGLRQVSALWRIEDGDLAAFAREHFLSTEEAREKTLKRLEAALEQVDGHLNEVSRELRRSTDLDVGPLLPVDPLLSTLDPYAHVTEDLFRSKVAFIVLLNFPLATLLEKTDQGPKWSRKEWAEARLSQRFARRVPGEVLQAMAKASAEADLYIAEYNIWMHHLLDQKGQRLFPSGLRLISHWNLRDELKASYSDPAGLEKQRMIIQVMERIVSQTIPKVVINNPHVDWSPYDNQVRKAPPEEIEANAPPAPALTLEASPEPDVRYAKLLGQYHAMRLADPYSPIAPTAIARSYELGRELPEERVKALLLEVLTSPLVKRVAGEIEKKLGRKLEPQDLWYNGFKARGGKQESELDAITKKKYPTAEAFARDIPNILGKLGFSKERAKYLAERIKVDAARGAGHAMPSMRRGDFPRLRTRVEKDGMNYKGYNIAIHELGHNVEQVFSLYDVDHTLLQGVPNNAFTEALAFVFQARDVELLGLSKPSAESEKMRVLSDFWATWEIAGVALVDNAVWHWMYDHPAAGPAELRAAAVKLAKEVWQTHYAPVLGGGEHELLGIYSHMIAYPLYLADYPLGHLIAFQIEEQLKKGGKLGDEFERVAKMGAVIPDLWMKNASGLPVSAGPLLRATEAALSQ